MVTRYDPSGIHAAMGRDYAPLTGMFERVILQTWKQHATSTGQRTNGRP